MKPRELQKSVNEILKNDHRYTEEAYYIINHSIQFSANYFDKPEFGQERHLTGKEICTGFTKLALEEFGAMASAVLKKWGIHTTLDIGHIVFNLIDAKVLHASHNDKLGDFDQVFDLHAKLLEDYLPKFEQNILLKKIDAH